MALILRLARLARIASVSYPLSVSKASGARSGRAVRAS